MADATIRDVARRAQVSVASVSRVLNRLDNVSEETKARVADGVGLCKAEASSPSVRNIAEFANGIVDAGLRFRAYIFQPVEDA